MINIRSCTDAPQPKETSRVVVSAMIQTTHLQDLIRRYDVPVPRYTSYPTVPCWDTQQFTEEYWWKAVDCCFIESNSTKGISLYIHLPFCESLCTYCACNTRITKNHNVEEKYIRSLLQEWATYKSHFQSTPVIRELHLGGGTPTFFSPANLNHLITSLLQGVFVHEDHVFSFEGHPNNTTPEHLRVLANLGFHRVSYGVQDLDPKVQQAIHRIQPFENLQRVTEASRENGFNSVSFDLVYGLPFQTLDSVTTTIRKIIALRPDRVSFYSYAHVPWLKPGQRGYEDADLPSDVVKRSLYEAGRELFLNAGYLDIGMDHFALPSDSLAKAYEQRKLHRNFMGYTDSQTDLLIGLGTSSISDAKYAYAQNEKNVELYHRKIGNNESTLIKGHIQTEEDLLIKYCILDLICSGKLSQERLEAVLTDELDQRLGEMEEEGIVSRDDRGLTITPLGKPFIRNICQSFDQCVMKKYKKGDQVFSKSI